MRRFLFILLIAGLAAFGFYRWQRLNAAARSGVRGAKSYTPAVASRLDPKDMRMLAELDSEYTRLIAAVLPSVVSVISSRELAALEPRALSLPEAIFGPRRPTQALGSGVIVSREGHILTNHHVITGMDKIEVQLADGRSLPARLIGSDETTDIAVLKIEAPNLEPLPLGDSDAVRAGQMVFAVGNPFSLQETVTQGIISATGRRAMADSGVEFLQTDAAINKGNSGGPLLNLRGEIIGINSSIYANSREENWLGISFAIPSNVARRALDSLLKYGRIVRGYLGVTCQFGFPNVKGTLVLVVLPDSPAERAGLRPQDIIRTFNGHPITDIYALREYVAEAGIHEKVTLGIVRDGHEETVITEIVEAPASVK